MIANRRATTDDLDSMLQALAQEEGYTPSASGDPLPGAERAKIAAFLTREDRAAWIAVDDDARQFGLVMCRFRDLSVPGTETTNAHVLELNRKMGYREIRRGPIWDEIERVSLVKDL